MNHCMLVEQERNHRRFRVWIRTNNRSCAEQSQTIHLLIPSLIPIQPIDPDILTLDAARIALVRFVKSRLAYNQTSGPKRCHSTANR